MSFAVGGAEYDRFMGRYSVGLASQLADGAGVAFGQRVLDVGCGPGALTGELVRRLGPEAVAAVDPSESFVAAARERYPGVDVRQAAAEDLPFEDGTFDACLAQLVVHFMTDPVAGLEEMARVTRPAGVVAACVWDFARRSGFPQPLLDRGPRSRPRSRGRVRPGRCASRSLGGVVLGGRVREVEETSISVAVKHTTFEDWWEPFRFGVGPAGSYLASLDPEHQTRLADRSYSRILLSCSNRQPGQHGAPPEGASQPLTGGNLVILTRRVP